MPRDLIVLSAAGLDGAAGLDVPATGHAAGVVAAGADNAASEIYTCAAGDMPLAQLLQMPGFLSFYNRTSDDSSSNDGISAATSMPIGDPPSVEDPPASLTTRAVTPPTTREHCATRRTITSDEKWNEQEAACRLKQQHLRR
jgi:hypothetical protein